MLSLNINLFTSKDQFCVCNLDEFFLYPVLRDGKEPKRQMEYALKGFLEYHKKKPEMEMKENDEVPYYTGDVYQKWNLSIRDVMWNINIPHGREMEDEQYDEINEKFVIPMEKLLDEMNVHYQFMC